MSGICKEKQVCKENPTTNFNWGAGGFQVSRASEERGTLSIPKIPEAVPETSQLDPSDPFFQQYTRQEIAALRLEQLISTTAFRSRTRWVHSEGNLAPSNKPPFPSSPPPTKDVEEKGSPLTNGPLAENQKAGKNLKKGFDAARIALRTNVGTPKPTSMDKMGVLGSKPGGFFGVGIPFLTFLAAENRVEKLENNPYAGEIEKGAADVAADAAEGSLIIGILNHLANTGLSMTDHVGTNAARFHQVANGTAKVSPYFSLAYSVSSGIAHYKSGEQHGYISQEANVVISGGEIAAGALNFAGSMSFLALASKGGSGLALAFAATPVGAAALVIAGGALALALPLLHQYFSSRGVGEQIAEIVIRNHREGNHDSSEIEEHINVAKSYGLFNETAILALAEKLDQAQVLDQIDWHTDNLVYDLRWACFRSLQTEINNSTFVSAQTAEALVFFARQTHDSAALDYALDIYNKEVGPLENFALAYAPSSAKSTDPMLAYMSGSRIRW